MCLAAVALVALLLLLTAAILRLAALLVALLTVRYTLAAAALALGIWLVDARRQCYAKGFYSCSQVPLTAEDMARQVQQEKERLEVEEEEEARKMERRRRRNRADMAVGRDAESKTEGVSEGKQQSDGGDAAVVMPLEVLPVKVKELEEEEATPPSETESEDDDSETSNGATVSPSSPSGSSKHHSKSLADVRGRSNTTDGLQRRQATRPRSSSAFGDRWSQSTSRPTRASRASATEAPKEKKTRHESRRRAATSARRGGADSERSRRATFTSKQDKQEAFASAGRSSSETVEDALRSDGYWIGDFRVQRRVVPRRGYGNGSSPKAS
ncbi:hypothetical protein BBJ28_00014488 [Nothophytophthora sp. Chile5]|nr:hypothetical protein BBJ28_00014488 [Nothophytophthora sp. Chile5]